MDVEPRPLGQERLGDEQAVCADHDDGRVQLEARLRPLGLERGNAEAVGDDGAFEPLEVQPDGGRRMSVEAWRRGLR